jgi:FeS assembly SUF system regulator
MSRLTDYGIVLLTQLAADAAQAEAPGPLEPVHNARELAARAGLPLPVVSKILKTLTREGLLHSHRGVKGGYALVRRPEDISVASIIDALEGPIALTECGTEAHGVCAREARCAVRQPWQQINREVRRTLERVRLSDLANPSGGFPQRRDELSLLLTDPATASPPAGAPAE